MLSELLLLLLLQLLLQGGSWQLTRGSSGVAERGRARVQVGENEWLGWLEGLEFLALCRPDTPLLQLTIYVLSRLGGLPVYFGCFLDPGWSAQHAKAERKRQKRLLSETDPELRLVTWRGLMRGSGK